jgi:hypothetical protein
MTLSDEWRSVISSELGVPVDILYDKKRGTSYTYFDKRRGKFVITLEPDKEMEALCHLIHEAGHVACGFESMEKWIGKYPQHILNLAEDIRINLDASSKYVGFVEGANTYNAKAVAGAKSPLQKLWVDIFTKSCNAGKGADKLQADIFKMAREMGMRKYSDISINYENYLKALVTYLKQRTPEELAADKATEKKAEATDDLLGDAVKALRDSVNKFIALLKHQRADLDQPGGYGLVLVIDEVVGILKESLENVDKKLYYSARLKYERAITVYEERVVK